MAGGPADDERARATRGPADDERAGATRARSVLAATAAAARGTLGFPLAAGLLWRVLIAGFVFVSLHAAARPDGVVYARPWLEPLTSCWDAGWYVSIAFDGYWYSPSGTSSVAFFPLFPLLVRALAFLVRDRAWAAALASLLAFLVALAGLHRLSAHKLGEAGARLTLVLMLAYPFAFFYASAYSEGLFLACAAWAFAFAEERRFLAAAVAGLLGAATRSTGLVLLPALALVGLPGAAALVAREGRRARLRALVRTRAPLALIPAGTLGFFAYLHFAVGDFWAHLRAERIGWGRTWAGALDSWRRALAGLVHPGATKDTTLLLSFYVLLAAAVLPAVVRLVRRGDGAYALFVVGLALPGALSGLEGFGRFLAPAFPLAWVLADAGRTRPAGLALGVAAGGLLQGLLLFLHVHGYWVT